MATVEMTESDGQTNTTAGVALKEPTGLLGVPFREVSTGESVCLGFRASMISLGDAGQVLTGTGMGNEFIELEWKGRKAALRASELLAHWVATFAPEDAEEIMQAANRMYEALRAGAVAADLAGPYANTNAFIEFARIVDPPASVASSGP